MDVHTLFFVEASLLFLFALTMIVNSVGQSSQAGNYWFAASNFCGGAGLILHSIFPESHRLTATVIPDLLLFVELSLLNKAVAEFLQQGRHLWLSLLTLSFVMTAGISYAIFLHPAPPLIVISICGMTISTALCSAVLLFRHPPAGVKVPTFVMGTLFALYAINNFIRATTAFSQPGYGFYYIWLDRTIIAGLSFGFLWMTAARLRAELENLAGTDALTGILNRRAIERETQRLIQRNPQRNECLSTLFLDVDYFKSINDSHGHHAGDLALRAVANCLRETMRNSDLIARLGGDEFLVIMPGTCAEMAHVTAARVRDRLAALRFTTDSGEFGIQASIGVTSVDTAALSLEDILKLGDRALYAAKAISRRDTSTAPEFAVS